MIRLDWDGLDKTWLVTSFTDDKGKFAGDKGTSDILDSCTALPAGADANEGCVPAATQQTSPQSIGANDGGVKMAAILLTACQLTPRPSDSYPNPSRLSAQKCAFV